MGIADFPDGPMMIAIRPVFADREDQHVAGYILMARYIDTTEVSRLSSLAQLPLEMFRYSDRALPLDLVTILPMFPASSAPFIQREGKEAVTIDAPIIIEPISSTQLGGYALIPDISGKPVLIIKVVIDRGIYAQGKSTTLYFVIQLIIAGLVFGLAILILLEKTVLSRLEKLSQGVDGIGRKRDFSARVHIAGQDEIGGLADRVNGMLEDLERSQILLHDKLIQSEENYRLFFNSVTDPICVCRMNPDNTPGRIVEVNDAACKVLGYERAEFLEMHLSDLLPGEKSGGVDLPTEILQSFGHVIYAGFVSTKTGKRIPVEVNARTFDQFGRPAIAVIIRDISEREEIEHLKKEAFQQIEKNLQDFAVLNDHIRNPLQGIVGIADMMDDAPAQKIITNAMMINEIVKRIDRGYIESEKIHEFLRKYYGIGKK
jgi:PAS domain S-box-containing protein